jgi:hypothetical protein
LYFWQAVTKINRNNPTKRPGTSGTLRTATKGLLKTTFTDADLPAACLFLWNECYIPLLCDWAGTLANPWNYQDAKMKDCLQIMWDITYPHIPADIQPKKAIFVRVSRHFINGISVSLTANVLCLNA